MDYQALIGVLRLATALHIGTGQGNAGFDAPVRRRNDGTLIIPGTSLAGVLRTTATRLAPNYWPDSGICQAVIKPGYEDFENPCHCLVCHLFGEINPGTGDDSNAGGRASRLWIYDAEVTEHVALFVRDNVGIDRQTGAAARQESIKYDTEVVPAGTTFHFRVELEEDISRQAHQLLALVFAEWQAGRLHIGGNRSRGLGALELVELNYHSLPFDSIANISNYLAEDTPWELGQPDENWLANTLADIEPAHKPPCLQNTLGVAQSWIEINFDIKAKGLFLINDTTAAAVSGFDSVSLLDGVPRSDMELRPILPGSSLRGAFRSHAERIMRTLATHQADDDKGDRQISFLKSCPACNPVESSLERPLPKCDSWLPEKADLATLHSPASLCLGCYLFGSARKGSRLTVGDAPLKEGTTPIWKVADFLAIDRFTGGALDTAKFDAAALWQPTFRVTLRLENPENWELGLLTLLLRDLQDGFLSVGWGAAKGFGQMTAANFDIQLGKVPAANVPWSWPEFSSDNGSGAFLTASFTVELWLEGSRWQTQMKSCVAALHQTLSNLKRDVLDKDGELRFPDSYFGRGRLADMYPVKPEITQ